LVEVFVEILDAVDGGFGVLVAVQFLFLSFLGVPPVFTNDQVRFLAKRYEHDQYSFGVFLSSLLSIFRREVAVILIPTPIGERDPHGHCDRTHEDYGGTRPPPSHFASNYQSRPIPFLYKTSLLFFPIIKTIEKIRKHTKWKDNL
jgi:hypothetical protein